MLGPAARRVAHRSGHGVSVKLRHTSLSIPAGPAWLDGALAHAPDVRGLALLLRPGSGDAPDARVAEMERVIQPAGFATLALGLLTRREAMRDPDAAFNVPQLANRILAVVDWIGHQAPLAGVPLGLIGWGTASGAAIRAGWKNPQAFAAIVCGGGRLDLAGAAPLGALMLPVRAVVGDADPERSLIAQAWAHLRTTRDWQAVPGSGLDEAGAAERFARLAADWLATHLPAPPAV